MVRHRWCGIQRRRFEAEVPCPPGEGLKWPGQGSQGVCLRKVLRGCCVSPSQARKGPQGPEPRLWSPGLQVLWSNQPPSSRVLPFLAFLSLLPQMFSEFLLCARLSAELLTWCTILPWRASHSGGRDRQANSRFMMGALLGHHGSPAEAWKDQRRFPEHGQKSGSPWQWDSAWHCSPCPG